ncbi:MAG: 2-phosphosulfolactate phosphatase [Spirochaetales bacterium]|nr:2-phosphosulfolactate phosphatase [Spirochaetales bacterium]
MDIKIWEPTADVERIRGLVVVIDVFRAFSTNCYIAEQNPKKLIPVDSIEAAFEIRREHTAHTVLVGERGGVRVDGFEYGNSPTEIQGTNLKDKIVVHTTTAGTKGLLRQRSDNDVVCGSFVNASAVRRYAEKTRPDALHLYCTARKNGRLGDEDYLCADYLRRTIENERVDFENIKRFLKAKSANGFSKDGFAPESDFEYCMALDAFDFVLKRTMDVETGRIELTKCECSV